MNLNKLLTSETSDLQLRQLANRLCIRLDGILFKDELSKLPILTEKRNYSYIIHLRNLSHWTGLFIDNRSKRAYYFNSFSNCFGDIPNDIVSFVKRNKCILYESDKPIQRPEVGYCGPYSVLWLSYMNRPTNDIKDFDDYLNLFKDMTPENLKYKKRHPDLPY